MRIEQEILEIKVNQIALAFAVIVLLALQFIELLGGT